MAISLGGGLLGGLDAQPGVLQLGGPDPSIVLVAALPPILDSPATEAAVDFTLPQTFTWTAQAPNAAPETTWALQRYPSAGGVAQWWSDTLGAWQATELFNGGGAETLTLPAGAFGPNGLDWGWTVATQNGSLAGPYAAANIVVGAATPVLTLTGPSGTLTTGVATVTWADSPTMSQVAWRAVVYSSAQAGASGWTPGVGPSVADSTLTLGTANRWPIPTVLPPDTYTIVVQGTDASGTLTAWAQGTVVVSYTAPATPTVSATWDSATNTATVTVTGAAGQAGDPVLIERSLDGGTTWAAVRPVLGAPSGFTAVLDGSDGLVYVDLDALAGAPSN